MCSIHLDDETAAILCQNAHHIPPCRERMNEGKREKSKKANRKNKMKNEKLVSMIYTEL